MTLGRLSSPRDLCVREPVEAKKLDREQQAQVLRLLDSVQLWSSRATEPSLSHVAQLMVDKAYDSPREEFYIWVWQKLALPIMQKGSVMSVVIQRCTDVMARQKELLEWVQSRPLANDSWQFMVLLPLLILKVFPKQAYANISLPMALVQRWASRWPAAAFGTFKTSQESSPEDPLSIALADALLLSLGTRTENSVDSPASPRFIAENIL
ncbi:hypothetical protein DM01DRAFT_92267 [Hesseltinella vesiculosa]|uniref:Uncharacterized protein n=1 Tax=Hesseltinella vesiculosa TaxID=101127 RepID=A0A1X2G2X6_9FUNG|nr:hypothetical protein DM01DRAFT_92267 [Hesseltinella vesiculosa]